LKGDNIRGVEVDFAGTEGALPNLGPLEACNWDIIGDEDEWINRHQHLVDPEASQLPRSVPPEQARGLEVTLEYEKHSYNALLLRDPSATKSPEGFTSLPLLMLKMPAPVRAVFLNYIRTSFDAHVTPFRLSPTFLTSTLETYFRRLTAANSSQAIRDVIRQVQLQLAFPNQSTGLKHIQVTISGNDVPGFVKRGKLLRKTTKTPFTNALASYLQKHLAIDLSNPKVQVSKITCNAFTLSTDRLKVAVPGPSDVVMNEELNSQEINPSQLAMNDFYISLVREATGTGKFLPDNVTMDRGSSTPSSDGNGGQLGTRRKRAVSNPASVHTNAKRSKARGKENGRGSTADQDTDMDGA
jgi:hypothetical protein